MDPINTERLIIRRFTSNDAYELYEYLSDEEVVRYEPYKPFTMQQAAKEAVRRADDEDFYAVALKDNRLIGNIYLSKEDYDTWELGYVFNRRYWKLGFAGESVRAVISHIVEKENTWRITAMCDPRNENSWRLLEKLGFRREGHLLKNVYFFKDEQGNPIWKDTYVYALLRENG